MSKRGKSFYWIKVWKHWYTGIEVAGLSGYAKAIRPVMYAMCRESAEETKGTHETVWFVDTDGRPYTTKALAALSGFKEKQVVDAIEELIGAGIMCRSENGIVGIPDFWDSQESKSARSMRNTRAEESNNKATSPVHSEPRCEPGVNARSDLLYVWSSVPLNSESAVPPPADDSDDDFDPDAYADFVLDDAEDCS